MSESELKTVWYSNRYWISIASWVFQVWASEDGEEMVCIGSIAELEALSGQKVTDLHRESVDPITIPSKRPGKVFYHFLDWIDQGNLCTDFPLLEISLD